jgi:hypothetical protein
MDGREAPEESTELLLELVQPLVPGEGRNKGTTLVVDMASSSGHQ